MTLTIAPPGKNVPQPEAAAATAKLPAESDVESHPHDRFIELVTDLVGQWDQPDWLDVGCGWHFDWPWKEEREKNLVKRARVVGLDPDLPAIRKHRSIQRRTVGTVETLPFSDASFDLVTANVVVEHLEHPERAFGEIFRVLKPGGVFVFRTPSARSYFVRIARRLPERLKLWLAKKLENREPDDVYPAHYLANTSEEVDTLCRTAGFGQVNVVVTTARGFLINKSPALARMERRVAAALRVKEGNLIVEARK